MNRPCVLEAPVTSLLRLDRRSRTPLFRQLYDRIRKAIASAVLRPGDRLPSARALAAQLGAARGTVDLAYSLLASEGYIESHGAAGTFVTAHLRGLSEAVLVSGRRNDKRIGRSAQVVDDRIIAPFQMGLPALDAFPRKVWSRLTARRARMLPLQALLAPDTPGHGPLRDAIASYVSVSRGVACTAGHVIVTPGFQGALALIARALMKSGDAVWFEDPGYFFARQALELCGARAVPVPVDAEGIDVAAGVAAAPRARFAYVTPSHQAPLGVALSLPRRLALLAWAAAAESFIIEDDYDSEFRYGSRPLPALKSLDGGDRVLYVGTFSKVLFPGLRLGYIVAPERVLDSLRATYQLLYRDRQFLDQAVTADFITEGHFHRHIRRMRTLYARRRDALAAALQQVFGDHLSIQLAEGGMHLLVRSKDFTNDIELVARAKAYGLAPAPLSVWGIARVEQGLLLSFTNIAEESALSAARRLKRAIVR
jgi:GntR family transcriptional regulator/MocR family aminotransferase